MPPLCHPLRHCPLCALSFPIWENYIYCSASLFSGPDTHSGTLNEHPRIQINQIPALSDGASGLKVRTQKFDGAASVTVVLCLGAESELKSGRFPKTH